MLFRKLSLLGLLFVMPVGAQNELPSFQQRLDELEAQEQKLVEQNQALIHQRFDIASIRNQTSSFVNSLTPEERLLIGTSDESRLPPAKAQALSELRNYLHQADEAQQNFLKQLDTYGRNKVQTYIEEIHSSSLPFLRGQIEELDRQKPKEKEAHQKLLKIFDDQYEVYEKLLVSKRLERPGEYNKDVRSFLDTFGRLLAEVQRTEPTPLGEHLAHLKAKLSTLFETASTLAEISPSLVKLFSVVTAHPYAPPPGQTPTLKAFDEVLKSLARARDQKIEVRGRENLPVPKDDYELNIILPVHRDIYRDPSVIAHLDLDAYHVFVAHDRFIPKSNLTKMLNLSQRVHDNTDFLPVGERGGESVARMFERLKNGGVKNIVIFPEGTTSLTGETGPIPETFVSSFLDRLRKQGYRLNLIPLTTDMAPGLRQSAAERMESLTQRNAVVTAYLHKAWSPTELEIYRSLEERQILTRLLRSDWISDMKTTDQLLFGQLRARPLADDMKQFLNRRLSIRSFETCVRRHLDDLFNTK